ncbi:hypothetical protein OH76DRAFT_1490657 [Lentinus brumalis]|uniref:Uncharacterized protein n=1 Tax=Lentinus brumalis TaxID=2498619 RepID=A0A371CI92_9APHY|nr:hypothetical protein OH76DRAFT_1490657 [Polyporus brumalis]
MSSPTASDPVVPRAALSTLDSNTYRPPRHSIPLERTVTALIALARGDLPHDEENTAASEWQETAAINLRNLIASVDSGEVRVELEEDHYTFIGRAALRTYVLRLVGRVSGTVAQVRLMVLALNSDPHSFTKFVLPASPAMLYSIPVVRFISWVHAFERGEFRVSDDITPAQRELLIDFARIWEGFARQTHVDRGWYRFIALLRWLVTDSEWTLGTEHGGSGFGQLAMLSRWAREYYPSWFPSESNTESDDDDMPELVEVYEPESDEEEYVFMESHYPAVDPLSLAYIPLSGLLLLCLAYYMRRPPRAEAQPNYVFTASTKVARRPPTVLQFSAHVPPGAEAMPTIIRTFDVPHAEVRAVARPKREEELDESSSEETVRESLCRDSRTPPRSILVRTSSAASDGTFIRASPAATASPPRITAPVEVETSAHDPPTETQSRSRSPLRATSRSDSSRRILTRSVSRSSLQRASSSGPATQLSILPKGLRLKREKGPIRYNAKHDTTPGLRYTYWFETSGERPILAPPLLHPACGLQRGDLFFHRWADASDPQFWLRQQDDLVGEDVWQSVDIGYVREDGRKLTLTDKVQRPSWVGGDWGSKRVSAIGRA